MRFMRFLNRTWKYAITASVFLIAGVLIGNSGHTATTDTAAQGSPPSSSSPSPSPSHNVQAKPSPVHTPTWHTIASFSGANGYTGNTTQFTISPANSGNWVMKYSYNCAGQSGGNGNFIVDEDNGNDSSGNGVQLNNLNAGQTAQDNLYGDAGTHYLYIQTQCPYTITAQQEY